MQPEKNSWNAYSDVLKPYYEKKLNDIHKNIIDFCDYINKSNQIELDYNSLKTINSFVGSLFFIFSQEEFNIPVEYIDSYFRLYRTLANIIRISAYRNSDAVLKVLATHPLDNIVKVLILYSAYNTILHNRQTLLSLNEEGISLWFCHFLSNFQTALADADGYKQLQYHLSDTSIELKAITEIKSTLFAPTYIDHENDRYWKSKFNNIIQAEKFFTDIDFDHLPEIKKSAYRINQNKIAIVSGCWYKNHSVYRNQYHFLKALSEKYELSLFSVVPLESQLDSSIFKAHHYIVSPNGKIDTSALEAGNFPVIYFTDIGLHVETTLLSNTRLAPIQATSYGHPVSTYGSKIDYWIGGLKGEQGTSQVSLDQIQERYSERFIGLPGLGIVNTIPDYAVKNIAKRTDYFIINCSWCAHKVNYDLIRSLKNILNRAKRENVVFRIFSCTYGLNFLTFRHIMLEHFGQHVDIIPAISYSKYMEMMEEGQFSIEPYPFGGCNTIVDALWLRQPVVCLEGDRWYGKIGTSLLLQSGIENSDKMLASNIQQYEDYIVNLINDDESLESARKKISNIDLNATIFDASDSQYFVQAIDSLLALI